MDQDVTDKNRMQNMHTWSGQAEYRRKLRRGKTGKVGGGIWVGLTRVEKIIVLYWGQSEMVGNSCVEDLEERMRLKRIRKLIPQAGEKRNE